MADTKTWEEAVETLTGPGAPMEIVEQEIDGLPTKVFANAPESLRAIFSTAKLRADEIFVVYEDERWTFGDVSAQVDAIGALLVAKYGIRPGDRVAIGMRNYPEWITSFAAITSIGAIAVCMNAWWQSDEMIYGLEDSGAKVLIGDSERIERSAAGLLRLGVRAVVVRPDREVPAGVDRLDEVLVPGAALPDVEIAPSWDAMILYTSGTTGRPKGAVSTHRAVANSLSAFACRALVSAIMKPPSEPHPFSPAFILAVPLFHVTGLVPVMMSTFAAGYKLVMMYKWDPPRALELIERERVTTFVGVPTMSWDLLECDDFASRDTSSLQSVGGGGAPAPPELVNRIESGFKRGRPGIGYGMTETCAYGPQNNGDDYLRKPRSSGRPVPVMDLRVTDPLGNELGVGEVGEIWFRGPMLIRGYWNKPEATAETIVDGWLRSGDIGRIDDEGFIFVEDRAKDMVLRAGENVYCAEVEAAIYEHPAVHEAAVFGVPHERLGEEVAVAIVAKAGDGIDADGLQSYLREKVASFKIPTIVRVHEEQLPRNAAGKILKRDLRDAIIEGQKG